MDCLRQRPEWQEKCKPQEVEVGTIVLGARREIAMVIWGKRILNWAARKNELLPRACRPPTAVGEEDI